VTSLLPHQRCAARMCGGRTARAHPRDATSTLTPHPLRSDLSDMANVNPPIPQQVAPNASLHPTHTTEKEEGRRRLHATNATAQEQSTPITVPGLVRPPVNRMPKLVKRDSAIASQVPLHPDANIDSIDVRRGCPMAREIFYQRQVDQAQGNPHIKCVGSCVTCGEPTGNYCDPCVNAGRTYVIPTGQILSGSPVCRQCEAFFHCYVCVGVVPPGPIGQPTAPIVNLTIPPAQQ
jgi:hypothetical protein